MCVEVINGMADTIAELEQKLAEREWIPVSERLPEDNRDVLMCLEWGIDIGTYDRGEWRSEWINHYDDDNVIAWMPLPEPYEESEEHQSEMRDYCEKYEPTYNSEDGSM